MFYSQRHRQHHPLRPVQGMIQLSRKEYLNFGYAIWESLGDVFVNASV